MSPPSASTPSPRRERTDKARNRARILEAAAAAFAASGMETQMDDVAARAGLGVGTLYRHFTTKDELMVAMARRKFTIILEVTRAGLEDAREPFEVVKEVLRAGAAVTAEDAVTQDALMRAGDTVWQGAADLNAELQSTMQVLIERAQTAGTMRADICAADIPMLMCGIAASMAVRGWDWRRHLEITLAGLSAAAVRPDRGALTTLPSPG